MNSYHNHRSSRGPVALTLASPSALRDNHGRSMGQTRAIKAGLSGVTAIWMLVACGTRTNLLVHSDGAVGIDAPRPDMGLRDAAPDVLEVPDFGRRDLGDGDLGPPDLGTDFGARDLGTDVGIDLGPPDLGPPDLGPPDMGPPPFLRGLRVELPCTGPLMGSLCPAPAVVTDSATLMGSAGVSYDVAFRIRGVTEGRRYTCTTMTGSWCVGGGTPSRSDNYNVWGLAIGSPVQQYYLNAGMEAPESFVLDDTHVVRIAAGATVTLTGDSINSAEFPNRDASGMPVVVPGVPPDPMAFDGEFVQIDVLSIVPAP